MKDKDRQNMKRKKNEEKKKKRKKRARGRQNGRARTEQFAKRNEKGKIQNLPVDRLIDLKVGGPQRLYDLPDSPVSGMSLKA